MSQDAPRIHSESIVIDAHCDTILEVAEAVTMPGRQTRDFFSRSEAGDIDLPRLKAGGVTCQVMALYVEPLYKPARSARRTLELLDSFYSLLDESEDFRLATTAADIERAKREGHVCALISIEGGEAIEGRLALLRDYYRMGVRAMGLTWNQRNDIADGQGEKSAGSGLTDFGISVVQEMERLGMLVDVSHLSDSSFWGVDKVADKPYIASHSNARSLCSASRNLTDKQIEALARKGGVIGVVFSPEFTDDDPTKASLNRLIDHIDHMRSIGGIDCVGLGSDFDGFGVPAGWGEVIKDASEYPQFTAGLLERGYTGEEVRKILGGNWMRVYSEVFK